MQLGIWMHETGSVLAFSEPLAPGSDQRLAFDCHYHAYENKRLAAHLEVKTIEDINETLADMLPNGYAFLANLELDDIRRPTLRRHLEATCKAFDQARDNERVILDAPEHYGELLKDMLRFAGEPFSYEPADGPILPLPKIALLTGSQPVSRYDFWESRA